MSTNDDVPAENVVVLQPRPPAELVSAELRLRDGGVEMAVVDATGNVDVLGVLPVPEAFRQRLSDVWPRWRASSAVCA